MMTQDRFEDLAGLYGPDIGAWPEPEQAGARAFLAVEPALAQAALKVQCELDALLDGAQAPAPDPALYDAVIASGAALRPATPRWAPMAAAAALVLGLSGGWLVSAGQMPVNGEEALYSTAFSVLAEDDTDWIGEVAR